MLIGINSYNEIMQINNITDSTLEVIEIDRVEAFQDKTDTYILCCKYIRYEDGYGVPLRIPYAEYLCKELEKENTDLKIKLQTAERTAAETSATVQELLELLIDMEVI